MDHNDTMSLYALVRLSHYCDENRILQIGL